MSNVIDSIQLSGTVYTIQGSGGGGNPTVELTQAEYDALVSAGTVSANTYYIITDAQAGDLTQYWTSAQTENAITQATSGKIDTSDVVTAVTSGSTDDEIPTAKAVYNAIPTGGSASYSAGRGIDITNDTISISLPISAGTGTNSIKVGNANNNATAVCSFAGGSTDGTARPSEAKGFCSFAYGEHAVAEGSSSHAVGCGTLAKGNYSHAEGDFSEANKIASHAEGYSTKADGDYGSHAEGYLTRAIGNYSHAEGYQTSAYTNGGHAEGRYTQTTNSAEHASGWYNVSSSASTTFGDSGNTLFSVGNGTADNARHNAFEIRQNGDIYLSLNGQDVKLQDQLGGGGGTIDHSITSGSSNAVESSAIWSATTYNNKEVTIVFDENKLSTNFNSGCTTIKVEVPSPKASIIYFYSENSEIGDYNITNLLGITVSNDFNGSSYEVSGNTVIITWPSSKNVTELYVIDANSQTVKQDINGAWVNENTYMTYEVDGKVAQLQSSINTKLDSTAYTPTVVDSTLMSNSTNPVQNKVLYDELRIDGAKEPDTTLVFEGGESTNFPSGCTTINVEAPSNFGTGHVYFYNGNSEIGSYTISNFMGITVSNSFNGSSYEVSGNTVIITWQSSKNVTKLGVDGSISTIIAIGSIVTIPLKDALSGKVDTSSVVSAVTSGSTDVITSGGVYDALNGLKLVKITAADYALITPDANTVYFIGDSNGYIMKLGNVSIN